MSHEVASFLRSANHDISILIPFLYEIQCSKSLREIAATIDCRKSWCSCDVTTLSALEYQCSKEKRMMHYLGGVSEKIVTNDLSTCEQSD